MNAIVNVNKKWGIGKDGDLLVSIREDMKFFRNTTKGKVVIMGRKTLDSFPGKAPLKNRVNIVITSSPSNISNESFEAVNADREAGKTTELIVTGSVEEAARIAEAYAPEDVFVIGGDSIYRSMLSYCDTCYVTVNDFEGEPDTFFPDLDADPEWKLAEQGDEQEENGIKYRFTVYRRKT